MILFFLNWWFYGIDWVEYWKFGIDVFFWWVVFCSLLWIVFVVLLLVGRSMCCKLGFWCDLRLVDLSSKCFF